MSQPVEPTAAPRRKSSCILIGCMVLVLLAAIPVAALWAVFSAAANAPPAMPRHASFDHPLPAGPGRVELDLSMADFEVRPAPPGTPLRLEGDWDASLFDLRESLTPAGDGWTYHVTFQGKGMRLFGGFRRHHQLDNRLRLYLPAGHPLALDGRLGMGEADLALGGLALQRVDLRLGMGQHRVSFAEPTTIPLELLRMDGSMGEVTVLRAGNASPRRVEIHHGMGDLTLDLSGAWKRDADVVLRLGMGNSEVQLPAPQEASALVERARVGLGGNEVHDHRREVVAGVPSVRIQATGGMGDLRIE